MTPEVIVTVRPDGSTTVEASHIAGPTCQQATAPYRRALGRDAGEQLKPEAYAQAETRQEVSQ